MKEYLDWLLWICRLNQSIRSKYWNLFYYLLKKPFLYSILRDRNRERDGFRLRQQYFNETGCDVSSFFEFKNCSVLEMLISLAIRLDEEYTGYPGEERSDKVFLDMIYNLGFRKFTGRFDPFSVDSILSVWMNREYKYDGQGSIFIIHDPVRDQREIEIWNQAMDYLEENWV